MTSPDVKQQATEEVQSLTGLIAIVTGGSDGIGYETTFRLAMQGARVYIMSRSTQKASDAITSMKVAASGTELDLHFLQLDLQDLASVTKAAEGFTGKENRLHILVNNAGIMAVPYALTKDGFETQWQTNYLGPFYLTQKLLPTMLRTASQMTAPNRVRIVNVSSHAAFVGIAPDIDVENPSLAYITGILATWKRYCHSKVAIALATHHLDALLQSKITGMQAYTVDPGVVQTGLQAGDQTILGTIVRFVVRLGLMPNTLSKSEGAKTTLICATSHAKEILDGSGAFFGPIGKRDKRGDILLQKWQPKDMEKTLWEASERMLEEKGVGTFRFGS